MIPQPIFGKPSYALRIKAQDVKARATLQPDVKVSKSTKNPQSGKTCSHKSASAQLRV